MKATKIEWCDHTFNPWWGCVRVSPGCEHCYAEAFAKRTGHAIWGAQAARRFFGDAHWREPLAWHRAAVRDHVRRRVFCASMADVFEDRPDLVEPRLRLFALIDETPGLDWLLLTKRPENIARLMPSYWRGRVWPNVWLGTTAEDQRRADARIPFLLQTPAAVRFVSCEPLLEAVDLRGVLPDPLDGAAHVAGKDLPPVDWCIVGGESGGQRRPCEVAWIEAIAADCKAVGVPVFVKQDAALYPGQQGRIPDALWLKQWPTAR